MAYTQTTRSPAGPAVRSGCQRARAATPLPDIVFTAIALLLGPAPWPRCWVPGAGWDDQAPGVNGRMAHGSNGFQARTVHGLGYRAKMGRTAQVAARGPPDWAPGPPRTVPSVALSAPHRVPNWGQIM